MKVTISKKEFLRRMAEGTRWTLTREHDGKRFDRKGDTEFVREVTKVSRNTIEMKLSREVEHDSFLELFDNSALYEDGENLIVEYGKLSLTYSPVKDATP